MEIYLLLFKHVESYPLKFNIERFIRSILMKRAFFLNVIARPPRILIRCLYIKLTPYNETTSFILLIALLKIFNLIVLSWLVRFQLEK